MLTTFIINSALRDKISPSDLQGLVTKFLPKEVDIESIALEIAKELSAAGYQFDANRLLSLA